MKKITCMHFLFWWAPCFTNFSIWPMSIEENFNMLPFFQCNTQGCDISPINSLFTIIPPSIISLPFYQCLWHHRNKKLLNVQSIKTVCSVAYELEKSFRGTDLNTHLITELNCMLASMFPPSCSAFCALSQEIS